MHHKRVITIPTSPHSEGELRRCSASRVILGLAKIPRLRRRAMLLAFRFEGGAFFSFSARAIMRTHFGVNIGAYSYGACFDQGAFQREVTIGRYVSIGPDVLVYRRDHPIDWLSTHPFFFNPHLGLVPRETVPFRPLEIGHDSWVGARVIITPGCSRIGLGSIVGAGAVLTRDVPDFAVVAGVPARVIRERFNAEICARISASRWWMMPIGRCVHFLQEFRTPLNGDVSKHPLLGSTSDGGTPEH
jgi:virginiamycin A acetyltransferase